MVKGRLCEPIERIARPALGAPARVIHAYTKSVFENLQKHWPAARSFEKDPTGKTHENKLEQG
jgi:hypothetical protein